MTIPIPEPDPTQSHPRDDQDDLVDVDVNDDLPDDGTRKHAEEVDGAAELPPG